MVWLKNPVVMSVGFYFYPFIFVRIDIFLAQLAVGNLQQLFMATNILNRGQAATKQMLDFFKSLRLVYLYSDKLLNGESLVMLMKIFLYELHRF